MKTFNRSRGAHGFTLIEMLCAVAITGVLSSLAYPSYQHVVHKVRRSDALAAVMQVQTAQERYRADHMAYGSLADIGLDATSPSRHYRLDVSDAGPTGYELRAQASGLQQGDKDCLHLRLVVDGNQVLRTSGRDNAFANGDAGNRRCWGI